MRRGRSRSTRSAGKPLIHRALKFESCEPRIFLAGDPVISEFLASNSSALLDGHGASSDWIELYNRGDAPIDLQGWHLTDDARSLTKWTFPSTTLGAGETLLVFASGNGTEDPAGNLHTNFRISRDGEFLALVHPDGTTITAHFSTFPAQLTDISYGFRIDASGRMLDQTPGFFDHPTPGAANPSSFSIGPRIGAVTHVPRLPSATDSLLVTAVISPIHGPVDTASLVYRVMYRDEVTVAMSDDGQRGDVVARDGIFTATIPAGVAAAGEMLRYYVVAHDVEGNVTRGPRVVDTTGDDQSPVYFGTVIEAPPARGDLPVFHWFTDNVAGAHTREGSRASVFYDGQFFDNVFVRQRGAFTNADSQKFEFNDGQPLRVDDIVGSVAEININAEGDDPTFVRQTLAHESYAAAGTPSSASRLMELRLNGTFDRVGVFIEQIDEDFLTRHGLDPQGALYKFVQRANNISPAPALADRLTGVQKKIGPPEDFSDLDELTDHLNLPTAEERSAYLMDHLNLPQVINYLAVRTVVAEADDTAKNFYLYRDTFGTGEWSIFPWDKDRTFGEPEEPVTNRLFTMHPFLGAGGNRLYQAVFEDPTMREMYLRHLRSVMDQLLQPPGAESDQLQYERRVDQLYAAAAELLDDELAGEIQRLKEYFPAHRESLYLTQSIDRVTDWESIETIVPEFVGPVFYFVPVDSSLGTSWTDVPSPPNIDQWDTGAAGIGFEREPENFRDLIKTSVNPVDACPTCTSLLVRIPFVVDDPTSIEELTLRMKYDDGFVAYLNGVEIARRRVEGEAGFDTRAKGHLDSEAVVFENIVISPYLRVLRPGDNMLAVHAVNINPTNSDMLISPELVSGVFGDDSAAGIPHAQIGNPTIRFGDFELGSTSEGQDDAYIQLRNPNDTAVDISGWRLSGGIEYTFQPGTVIPAHGAVYVSPDVRSFRVRDSAPTGNMGLLVQGDYARRLSDRSPAVALTGADNTLIDLLQPSRAVTGDANQDGVFNRLDIVMALQAGRYLAGSPATWQEGDWNGDGMFDGADLAAARAVGKYTP